MKNLLPISVLWSALILLVILGATKVSAECRNPEWDKRDTRSAESFLKYRDTIREWKKQGKTPSISLEEAASISGNRHSNGTLLVEPDQDYAIKLGMGFSGGLGAVVDKGRVGFIDTAGNLVIKPKYTSATCFSEGLAAVEIEGKWGFIDKQGRIAIPLDFDFALSFSEGLALVKVGKRWGYLDRSGKLVIEPRYEDARSFSEGLANVRFYDKDHVWTSNMERKGRWRSVFIDKSGNSVIGPLDGAYYDFTGGMALVSRQIGYQNGAVTECYFIDKQGKSLWIVPSPHLSWFSEDVMTIQVGRDPLTNGAKYSILDRSGKRLTERSFNSVSPFSEGLAVAEEGGYSGFIDRSGEYVLKPVYSSADSFSGGLASVYEKAKGKYGFIDMSGNWKIDPLFDWTGFFHEGKAAVAIGNKFGYIDNSGKYIWKPTR